jgi:hypothetical protein
VRGYHRPFIDHAVRVGDLADTSDDILKPVERLRLLEKERRREPASSRRFHELAEENRACKQGDLPIGREGDGLSETLDTTETTIDDVSAREDT